MIPLPCNTEQDCPTKFTFPLLITELEREAFIDELLWLSLDTGGWLVSQVGDCPLTSRTPDTITQQGMVLTELARHLLFSHWIFHVLPVLETGNKCSLIYLIFSSTSLDWCRKPELDWPSDCCCWRISISPQSVLAGWRVLVVVQSVQAHHNYPPVVHVTSNSPEYNKSYCRPSLLFYFLQNYISFSCPIQGIIYSGTKY